MSKTFERREKNEVFILYIPIARLYLSLTYTFKLPYILMFSSCTGQAAFVVQGTYVQGSNVKDKIMYRAKVQENKKGH